MPTSQILKQLLAAIVSAALLSSSGAIAQTTALDRYVAQPDPVYAWRQVAANHGDGFNMHVLELTSQTWRSAKDVDRPVWKHWLTITVPDHAAGNMALLMIGGGKNGDPAPAKPSARAALIATETGSVVAELGMVPNQPLRFTDSPDIARSEDGIIAYSRVKHFATNDDTWLVRLAMVKSAVRAMDAVQQFLATADGGKVKIDQFVVEGGSKRGWTTWLVGAVDPRVVAIVPVVIDALNSEAITKHQFEAYGFFSPALKDYVEQGLFPYMIGTPEYRAVLDIEDPYCYRNRPRLRMPKFMIDAAGDQYFLPDNSQFYYRDLPEEKHIRYVPNAKHNLAGSDATDSIIAFYQCILNGTPRPRFSWTKGKDGSLVVKVVDRPKEALLWQATNPKARDFRLDVIGKAYTSTALQPTGDNTYVAKVEKPNAGFTAFFVELTYAGPGKYPLKFTTEVSVVPDILPYKWQDAAAKYAQFKPKQ